VGGRRRGGGPGRVRWIGARARPFVDGGGGGGGGGVRVQLMSASHIAAPGFGVGGDELHAAQPASTMLLTRSCQPPADASLPLLTAR